MCLSPGTTKKYGCQSLSVIKEYYLKVGAEASIVFTSKFPMSGNIARSISAIKMLLLHFPAFPSMGRPQSMWVDSRTPKASFNNGNDV